MSKRIGMLTIHGIGEEKEDFDQLLKKGLAARLPEEIYDSIECRSIWFHEAISGVENRVWRAMSDSGLRYSFFRHLALFYLSDVTAYESRADTSDSMYRGVHLIIHDRMKELAAEVGENAPIIIVAHSLGCQVMSNYIWDACRSTEPTRDPLGIWKHPLNRRPSLFEAMGTLRYFITTGCNIPLFVSGFKKIEAFPRPNPDFQWLNYYDKDDVLGWPLKPLSTGFENAYDVIVTEDVPINAGFTPLSHLGYWKSRRFLRPVAKRISELYREL